MRSQDFAATAAIALAAAALSLAAAAGLSALASRETFAAWAAPQRPSKTIFCPDGENRQFSNIHHAWVCRTEPGPGK